MWMAMNYGHDVPEADLIAWQDRIFGQDRPILESQRPELLPLDLAAELNVRADRTAVMYRRWLRRLGVSFGTPEHRLSVPAEPLRRTRSPP